MVSVGRAETARLRLEPWGAPAHTKALVQINADPEVTQFLGGPSPPEVSAAMSARLAGHWSDHGFGLWAVIPTKTNKVVGFAGLCHPRWHPEYVQHVEVAWRLARSAWGHGYATEAARAALEAAWSADLDEVLAFIDPGNQRSRAVAERLRFAPQHTTRDPRSGAELDVLVATRPDRAGSGAAE